MVPQDWTLPEGLSRLPKAPDEKKVMSLLHL